jgi:hypothetical protein
MFVRIESRRLLLLKKCRNLLRLRVGHLPFRPERHTISRAKKRVSGKENRRREQNSPQVCHYHPLS